MLIDILYLLLVVFAVFTGFRQGLIVGIFSFIGMLAGLAAALKLSVTAARYLEDATTISARWLPVISFILVFIVVVMLVRVGAALLEKLAEALLLGIFNKLGGILLYLFLYSVVFSILLFYFVQVGIFQPETIGSSVAYPLVSPLGPWMIDQLGTIIPFFQDMFAELQQFFERFADKQPATETL